MSLLQDIFRPKPPSFNLRKEKEKLKNNLETLQWTTEGSSDSGEPSPVIKGITQIREVAGIVENKLRVFGLESPKHFTCSRSSESDEFAFSFTSSGLEALAKKGITLNKPKH